MKELKEGTVELHVKVNGKDYALGLELDKFPTREVLERAMRALTGTMFGTLIEIEWFKEQS